MAAESYALNPEPWALNHAQVKKVEKAVLSTTARARAKAKSKDAEKEKAAGGAPPLFQGL